MERVDSHYLGMGIAIKDQELATNKSLEAPHWLDLRLGKIWKSIESDKGWLQCPQLKFGTFFQERR